MGGIGLTKYYLGPAVDLKGVGVKLRDLLCFLLRDIIIIIIIIITVFVRRKLLIKSTLSAQQTKAKHTHTHTHISRHARTHAMKPTVGVVGVEQIRIIIRERKTSEFLGTS